MAESPEYHAGQIVVLTFDGSVRRRPGMYFYVAGNDSRLVDAVLGVVLFDAIHPGSRWGGGHSPVTAEITGDLEFSVTSQITGDLPFSAGNEITTDPARSETSKITGDPAISTTSELTTNPTLAATSELTTDLTLAATSELTQHPTLSETSEITANSTPAATNDRAEALTRPDSEQPADLLGRINWQTRAAAAMSIRTVVEVWQDGIGLRQEFAGIRPMAPSTTFTPLPGSGRRVSCTLDPSLFAPGAALNTDPAAIDVHGPYCTAPPGPMDIRDLRQPIT